VPPYRWDKSKNRPQDAAFEPAPGKSLSVYRTDIQSPRGVLQLCIDDQKRKLDSADERKRHNAEIWFEKNGESVEQLVSKGWRIVRLPIAVFIDRGFQLDGPDQTGHQNVIGNEYTTYSVEFAELAEILTLEECVANP
jgi:hypothetical protein